MSTWIKCDTCETMTQLDDRPCDRNGDLAMPDGWVYEYPNSEHLCPACDRAIKTAVKEADQQARSERRPTQ